MCLADAAPTGRGKLESPCELGAIGVLCTAGGRCKRKCVKTGIGDPFDGGGAAALLTLTVRNQTPRPTGACHVSAVEAHGEAATLRGRTGARTGGARGLG